MPFPESGSVTVASWAMHEPVSSFLTVETADSNAVVQLIDPTTGRHAISIYVSKNDRIRVPVPQGTFRLRLIEGQKWHRSEEHTSELQSLMRISYAVFCLKKKKKKKHMRNNKNRANINRRIQNKP